MKRLRLAKPTSILEKEIEAYLYRQVKKIGGKSYKFVSPGQRSVPDRICVFPGNLIYFVEVKRPGGKITPGQSLEIDWLRNLGCKVIIVWCKDDVARFINHIRITLRQTV